MGGFSPNLITRTTPSEPYRFTSARFVGTVAILDARGGDKICFWKRTKKPSHDLSTPKNRWAAKFLSSSETCTLRYAFAKSERALQYTAPIRTSDQAARLPTSFLELFSFWQRKKCVVFLFQKAFCKSPYFAYVPLQGGTVNFFLFGKEKMGTFPPLQREKFFQTFVCPRKKW